MYLASGWHDGLRLLLEAGFPPRYATEEALREDDLEALRITCGFTSCFDPNLLHWATLSSDTLQQCLVAAIRKGRDNVVRLCYQYCTGPELAELGLPSDAPIDRRYHQATVLLRKKLSSDTALFRKHRNLLHGLACPVYVSCLFWTTARPARTVPLLEKLYEAGFCDIDGQAVFARILWQRLPYPGSLRFAGWALLNWIAGKAIMPLTSLADSWPSAIFDMALAWGNDFWSVRHLDKLMAAILGRLSARCDATQRDGCDCFCSLDGCLPSRMFLMRKLGADFRQYKSPCDPRPVKDHKLDVWCRACLLDESWTAVYFEDAVRLEVFNRLDMVHTCCKVWVKVRNPSLGDVEARCASDDERQHVQDEDTELKEQLELILEAYRNYASRHGPPTQDMLKGWWPILDGILPPAIAEDDKAHYDAADSRLHDRRAALDREVLARQGYGDLDFMEVIRRHFAEYLGGGGIVEEIVGQE
jgi:hypothetical protein